MIVAIDLTFSNGEFTDDNSLHALKNNGKLNQY